MSYEENLQSLTLEADNTIGIFTGVPGQPGSAVPNGGKQYHFVKVTGTNQCGLATAATDVTCGILQNKPQQPGAAATVGYAGVSNVVASAAISAGALVAPTAAGAAVTDATNGKWQALKAAAGAGELIPVLRVR
jgi:hypothetical protein